jgi:hypothetical protein
MIRITRRATLLGLAALALSRPTLAGTPTTAMTVYKDPNCGCCGAWVDIVQKAGFDVTVNDLTPEALQSQKAESGIAPEMASCHTALVESYVIEGHVPPDDIRRLLAERPDAIGLSVPGMPFGSPGMGPESEREAYAVHLIRRDSTTEIFASYPAAT